MTDNTRRIAKPFCTLSLDDMYCRLVREGALNLLSETGMRLDSERARAYLAQFPGVRTEAGRVRFGHDMLREYLDSLRDRTTPPEKDTPFTQEGPWSCFNYADASQGIVRPGTEEDLVRAVRFLDVYGVPGHVPPVVLSGYAPQLRDLHGTRICMENSPAYGAPTFTPAAGELELYREMSQVVKRKVWILAMLVSSPMRFDDGVLEFVLDNNRDPHLDIEMTGGMPSCGSTAPLVFPAAHIQALAEDLAACLFMHFVTGEYHYPGLRSDPFDLRYGTYCVGSPEYILLDLASRRLFEGLFGVPRSWGFFLSMSKWPDQQAAHERGVGCWLQALAGAVNFKGSGQLSSDEVFSPEQVVIDRSIMKGAERMLKGLAWTSSLPENLEILHGGFIDGDFLQHTSTLKEYQDFISVRELFPATNLGQWENAGRPTTLESAADVVSRTLATNTFQRDPAEIRELRRICKQGEYIA